MWGNIHDDNWHLEKLRLLLEVGTCGKMEVAPPTLLECDGNAEMLEKVNLLSVKFPRYYIPTDTLDHFGLLLSVDVCKSR